MDKETILIVAITTVSVLAYYLFLMDQIKKDANGSVLKRKGFFGKWSKIIIAKQVIKKK